MGRWQSLTVILLIFGYAGYYLCQSNLSVTQPLIIDDLARRGWDANSAKISFGALTSIGVFAYAVGKFLSGGLTDLLGVRRAFLLGASGAIICTALFALGGGFPVFIIFLANLLLLRESPLWIAFKDDHMASTHRQMVSVRQPNDASADNRIIPPGHNLSSRTNRISFFYFVTSRRAVKSRRD
jgi:hypothetical protein